jgi:hypothetical protein
MTTPVQNLSVHVHEINFDEVTSGTAFNIGDELPNGTIVSSIDTVIVTPFDSVTSDVLDIGHAAYTGQAAVANAYRNDTDLQAAAGTKAASTVVPGLINTVDGGLQLTGTWTGVGTAPTEGKAFVFVSILQDGREHFDI